MSNDKMPCPCSYGYAFDMIRQAVEFRSSRFKYPEGSIREIALKCVGACFEDEFISRAAAAMEEIERKFRINPRWDGSIA